MGLIGFDEPFSKFRAHGLLIKEGAKMSKSHGNVINPDEYVDQYGADTLRMYLMFLGPYTEGGDFRDSGIIGIRRFLERVHRLYCDFLNGGQTEGQLDKSTTIKLHQTIKKVGRDLEVLSYNTAIAALMELLNALRSAPALDRPALEVFAKLLAPFAPHEGEELWEMLGHQASIFDSGWPPFEEALTLEDAVEIAIQVLGKLRGSVTVRRDATQEEVREAALADDRIAKHVTGRQLIKLIHVPNRLMNFVVRP
jgi:leucyl-tRNA synthetase